MCRFRKRIHKFNCSNLVSQRVYPVHSPSMWFMVKIHSSQLSMMNALSVWSSPYLRATTEQCLHMVKQAAVKHILWWALPQPWTLNRQIRSCVESSLELLDIFSVSLMQLTNQSNSLYAAATWRSTTKIYWIYLGQRQRIKKKRASRSKRTLIRVSLWRISPQ